MGTTFPLCVYDLWVINKVALQKAEINLTSNKTSGFEDGDYIASPGGFNSGNNGIIYHSQYKPLPNNTWVEVTHMTFPTELRGMWVFRTRGSGIWANTGNTIVFPTPKNMSKIHADAFAFLTKDCKAYGNGSFLWPRMESVIYGDCAREKGYDSIQFDRRVWILLPLLVLLTLSRWCSHAWTASIVVAPKTPARQHSDPVGWLLNRANV